MDPVLTSDLMNMNRRLHEAATKGDVELLESVIRENNTDILHQVTPLKHTCLHLAARFGRLKVVHTIHTRCPTLYRTANSMGDTPLHTAARAGHLEILRFLIDCAKNSSSPRNVERGRAEAIDLLREANRDGNTVMHEAAGNCHLDVVKLLMQEDPELLNTVNGAGESPLYLSIHVEKKAVDVVKQILESPHVSFNGRNGRTALHAAVIHGRQDMAKLLLGKNPGLVEEVDDNRRTPLHFASALGILDSVKMLLKCDTSTTCFLDKFGSAPIHLAARFGRRDIIGKLIVMHPDITELQDERCRNILHIAVESMQVDVVKYILKRKALEELLNGRNFDGNTPLHLAAISGNPCIVCLLLELKRVDTTALNRKGETAIAIARSKTEESNVPEEARWWVLYCLLQKKRRTPNHEQEESVKFLWKKWHSLYPEETVKSFQEKSLTLLVVATLVVTVTFAAAFTTPGGYNDGGMPILQKEVGFVSFIDSVSDGLYLSVGATFVLILIQFMRDRVAVKWMVMFAQVLIGLAMLAMTSAFTEGLKLVSGFEGWSVSKFTVYAYAISYGDLPVLAVAFWLSLNQFFSWDIKRRYRKFGCEKEQVSILFSYDP